MTIRLPQARMLLALCALVGIGLVAGGVALAHWLNLAACPLCILQRMLYLLLALFAALGVLVRGGLSRRIAALAVAATAATGAFVAGYQVWIQLFARETNCVADMPWWERLVDWAGEQLPLLFGVSGLCSEPGWTLLGLSIAQWSTLAFGTLFVAAVLAAIRARG